MKHILIAIVLIVTVLVASVFLLAYLGFLPDIGGLNITDNDGPEGSVKLKYSDFEIVHIIEILRGKDLVDMDVLPYVDALHMEVYGVNDKTANEVHQEYKVEYAMDNFISYAETADYHSGWTAYHEIWYKGLNGKSISVGDGASVTSAYDYDTMVLLSHGPLTTYVDFISVL